SIRKPVSATVAARQTYDAFGRLDTTTGSTWNGSFGYGGQYGYQTEGSGLQLLGHRWYDAKVGRFLTRDPIKDGRNWYAYCGNNPIANVDVSGLTTLSIGGGGQLILGTISVSIHLDVVIDDDGTVGGSVTTGSGGALGLSAGVFTEASMDGSTSINDEDGSYDLPPSYGYGFTAPVAAFEILDTNQNIFDGTAGIGGAVGPAAGGGIYNERRETTVYPWFDFYAGR
ncbi:RHS repeat-associated core domain-containing protein, partial [bacterium]